LPLQFKKGDTWGSLGLDGTESYDLPDLNEGLRPHSTLAVVARHPERGEKRFEVDVRIDTPVEIEYYRHGGILQKVVRDML
jgi:aconitate hydratase